MAAKPTKQEGLTLLELLISMTLMSLILILLFGGLRLANRSWDAGQARAEETTEVRLVTRLLRRTLRQLVPTIVQDTMGAHLAFEGMGQSLTFTAPLPAHLGPGGLYVITLSLNESGDAGQLRLVAHPYRPESNSDAAGPGTETVVLVEGVQEGAFTYFGSPDPTQPPAWSDRWDSPLRLPQLVRLRLTTGSLAWPELTVALKNDVYSSFNRLFPGQDPVPQDHF